MIGTAERIYLEGEENGWELVVALDEAPPRGLPGEARVNVHGIASSGELREQLLAMVAALNEWETSA